MSPNLPDLPSASLPHRPVLLRQSPGRAQKRVSDFSRLVPCRKIAVLCPKWAIIDAFSGGVGSLRRVIRIRAGTVVARVREWSGATECTVRLRGDDDGTPARLGQTVDAPPMRALAYTELVGTPEPGDAVLVNVTALERGLGTGGLGLVVALPDRLPSGPAEEQPGHLVKARYTPLQTMVLGVDEQESRHHDTLADADSVSGLVVVVADLHSAVPAIIAGLRQQAPDARVAYLMTDGGALPLAFSHTVAGLRESGWLASSISVGQAFGGDLEAVTVHTGLLAAALVVGADVAVIAQGPGNLGTGTRWGFSGVMAGEAVNAAAVLGGRPVATLRVSGADLRERHRGISHHSLTAYGRVALVPADVPVPVLEGPLGALVREQAGTLEAAGGGRLRLHDVEVSGLEEALAASPVTLSTMGRGYADDPASFLAAAAAGRYAASLL